ncbi:TIM21-domain-containing protein [Ampelomyces quisqualis]|uniref:Mitochondrial import inner membrane translocase subunit Tim21 n=1 Tax=Ampelomyces quisqualis TaxID=50730 RepID=A0A6A5QDD8_AMPQU|nr:TIM21-domain-containing protein [Ampelomyces quisqualis]
MTALYRPCEAIARLRPSLRLPRTRIQPRLGRTAFSTTRNARATHSSTPTPPPGPQRKSITLTGDTGQVRWSDLSPGEKAVRTTQQSVNLLVVLVGVLATGAVGYFMFSHVFSPSSETAHFNRAVSMIRSDSRCQALLGPPNDIAAFGEASWSRMARHRYISSTNETDRWGTEHMRFRFFVEGPLGQGVVHVHLVKRPSQSDYVHQELAVHVKGHQKINLVEDEKKNKVAPKIFGARWW